MRRANEFCQRKNRRVTREVSETSSDTAGTSRKSFGLMERASH